MSQVTLPISVTAGVPHAVGIAWLRKDVSTTKWSNLDLEIYDGSTLVAISDTPRNTYEVVRFTPTTTTTYRAVVTADFLEKGFQDFALAVAESVVDIPTPGSSRGFGQGCYGSGGAASTVCYDYNPNAHADQLIDAFLGDQEIAIGFSVPSIAQPITGMEVLLSTTRPALLPIAVYRADPTGAPLPTPAATGTMWVGRHSEWYRGFFSPAVTVIPGEKLHFAVKFDNGGRNGFKLPSGISPTTPFSTRRICGGAWDTLSQLGEAGIRLLCGTSGRGETPVHYDSGVPQVGTNFNVHLARAASNVTAILSTGVSDSVLQGMPLPIDLTPNGSPGCMLRVSNESLIPTVTDGQGNATVSLVIPNDPALVGEIAYNQFLVFDDAANAAGLVTTLATRTVVGLP